MILALLLAATSPIPFVSSVVEKPVPAAGFSTTLETNGDGGVRAVPAQTALDAERAFAADARTLGQWSAFRQWAAPDAVMFVPQPTNAHAWLKDRKSPERPVRWQPIASYLSCDGNTAVNTGAWQQPDGSFGYFTTVWQKRSNETWRWLLDSGDALEKPRTVPTKPIVWQAACTPPEWPVSVVVDPDRKEGHSADNSLRWTYHIDKDHDRWVGVGIWNGTRELWVVDDHIAAPAK